MGVRLEVVAPGDARTNIETLMAKFGNRPGDYSIDPYWFRRGMGNKPYVWDNKNKKWRLIRIGDEFDWDDEGNVVKIGD